MLLAVLRQAAAAEPQAMVALLAEVGQLSWLRQIEPLQLAFERLRPRRHFQIRNLRPALHSCHMQDKLLGSDVLGIRGILNVG